jgi:hypothetical protein
MIARSALPCLSRILETTPSCVPEETAMHPTIGYDLAQAHVTELRQQAQRDALARAARKARRQRSGHRAHRVLVADTAWARRQRPAPESP